MSLALGALSVAGGLYSALSGKSAAKRAAREQKKLLEQQQARNEAWYNRNYYRDYLNSVEAQNAIKRVRDAWAERTQEARARQAITGGTPEQAVAVAEAGGRSMGEAVAGLAAQGSAIKRQVDAQKAQMDANLLAQRGQIADNEQQAGMNLASNGMGLVASGLQSVFGGIPDKDKKEGEA